MRYGRKSVGAIPEEFSLPNHQSPCQTPASLAIDLHYAKLQIWERWDWNRFTRLAAFLDVTLAELASLACFQHRQLESFKRRNHLYNGHSPNRSAALLLTLLENHCCKAYTNDVIAQPFPNLSAPSKTS